MMCCARLTAEVGRHPILMIELPSCVLFTITLAPIRMVDRSSGASGSSPVRSDRLTVDSTINSGTESADGGWLRRLVRRHNSSFGGIRWRGGFCFLRLRTLLLTAAH